MNPGSDGQATYSFNTQAGNEPADATQISTTSDLTTERTMQIFIRNLKYGCDFSKSKSYNCWNSSRGRNWLPKKNCQNRDRNRAPRMVVVVIAHVIKISIGSATETDISLLSFIHARLVVSERHKIVRDQAKKRRREQPVARVCIKN